MLILNTLSGERNPLVHDCVLKNIMTGINAQESVDVEEAKTKGEKILSSMSGLQVNTYSFKRHQHSRSRFVSKNKWHNRVPMGPQLLFQ